MARFDISFLPSCYWLVFDAAEPPPVCVAARVNQIQYIPLAMVGNRNALPQRKMIELDQRR
ncbi:hypothetical protein ACVWYH_004462 [Bradyrhizobium sp. GM24.11]